MDEREEVNLASVEKVALALEEINDEVIYVGGAIVGLYVDEKSAEQLRPTRDIDVSVQISSYSQMDKLRKRLVRKKIFPEPSADVMYRYSYQNLLIDFIPYEETPLGPTNKWLKPGFNKSYPVTLGRVVIKILPVSYFVATKWEAFKSRGDDPRMSHDFEDIIFLIDNRYDLPEDIAKADSEVQSFLQEMSDELLSHASLYEIIECQLNPLVAKKRREMIVANLVQIRSLS